MTRVVVITGSSGAIGSALRRRFSADGDLVIGLDATDDTATIGYDVADENAVAAAFTAIRDEHGHPTVLVNNAGMTGAGGVEDEDPATWRRILDVNLTGAYLCAREVVGGMRAVGGGKIVNVASVNARFGGSALSGPAYAASKGGLVTLSRFLALEHAADNIQVNAVAPGPHDTPMWAALDLDLRERILAGLPGDGPGNPDDLASIVHFLCGSSTGYLTGATIDVNGGQWMG
jgi:NAD(P)-dependent dehydrogenase (short-subunit alcohol dehydrogenase family)